MKRIICLITGLILIFSPLFAQQPPSRPGERADTLKLTTFNLDFAGGAPSELVKAIEKASGKPLNVIINKEDDDIQIPALKMEDVNVAQLFDALAPASRKSIFAANNYNYQTSYAFNTTEKSPSDNSIWFFHAEKGLPAQARQSLDKICEFYQLANYLDRGFTVDDITTAIQAGWKMAGIASSPELNYHKETKMLIAYGDSYQLRTVASVLQSLPRSNATVPELEEMQNSIRHLQEQIEKLQRQLNASVPPAGKDVK